MAFLREDKMCSKLDRKRNEVIREKLQVFSLNKKLKNYKLRWKEHLERMSGSRMVK